MEESAAKRRKTSPSASIPVNQAADVESTTPTDPPPGGRKRASYASPTKSSLARHNPEILRRRQQASSTKYRPEDLSQHDASQAPEEQSQQQQQEDSESAELINRQLHENLNPRRIRSEQPESTAVAALQPSRSPVRKLGGALATRPRRSSVVPAPRPLPPPAPEGDEEILDPFMGRTLRRSPFGVMAREPIVPEPELPPTPERPDPVVSTPPSGIHNTPSRKPRRSRALAERIASSPTKRLGPISEHRILGSAPPAEEAQQPESAVAPPEPLTRSRRVLSWPSEARGVRPEDPDADKKRQRDALRSQLEQLESDLRIIAAENERIRQAHLVGLEPAVAENGEEVLGVLRRQICTGESEQPDGSVDWLQAALNPIAFLPFNKPTTSLPTLFSESRKDSETEDKPISHHPIPMDAEEALPYLQVFTPLSFTSKVSILPTEDDAKDSPIYQRHSIQIRSSSPPGLFSARLEMTVNTSSHAITHLSVPKIDPAAAAELGPFIEGIVGDRAAGISAIERNITLLTWAMAEWLRLAVRRAKAWRSLDRALRDKELATTVAALRAKVRRRGRRRGRRHRSESPGAANSDAGHSDAAEDDSVEGMLGDLVNTDDLLPYMGLRSMDVRVPALVTGADPDQASTLRVEWRIEFDWTGEGRNRIGVFTSNPAKWHNADDRNSLASIPSLFDELLQKGTDPVVAVRTVVALLAGGQGGPQ
ncbi:hypothetical protein VTK73DRAFT_3552 [Phialemonium thermophilum]|uniref:Uncharacterized protein n=1 Tax=Phialemonium thermophilum TaxID=223376 RepID=A0ABR3Y0K9_9PEZI